MADLSETSEREGLDVRHDLVAVRGVRHVGHRLESVQERHDRAPVACAIRASSTLKNSLGQTESYSGL